MAALNGASDRVHPRKHDRQSARFNALNLIRRIVNVRNLASLRFSVLRLLFLQPVEAAAIGDFSAGQLLRRRPTEVAAIAMNQPIGIGIQVTLA